MAVKKAERPGGKPPETFDFLGFTHIAKRSLRGYFTVHVRTMRKRLKHSINAVALWCKQYRYDTLARQQTGLNQKMCGTTDTIGDRRTTGVYGGSTGQSGVFGRTV